MEQEQTAIVTFQASQNRGLATALNNIEGAMLTAAEQNLDSYLAVSGETYTGAERRAMVVCEQLKLVNGMDLAAVLLRGKLVKQIREEGLWTQHPQGYHSLEEMARDQGIAPSELSNSITLCETIFPYLEAHLGISVPVIWEQIGKSNFRELIPTLMGIITVTTVNATVAASVESIMTDTAATLSSARQAQGDNSDPTEEELNNAAIATLLEQGGSMTNRELRATVRTTRRSHP
jgi:hypothetical protein